MESTKTISIEFTEDEVQDLMDELMKSKQMLENTTDQQIKDIHKDQDDDVQQMFVNFHKGRIETIDNTIDKLKPYCFIADEDYKFKI